MYVCVCMCIHVYYVYDEKILFQILNIFFSVIESEKTIVILGRNEETAKKEKETRLMVIKLLCETFGQLEWISVLAQRTPYCVFFSSLSL